MAKKKLSRTAQFYKDNPEARKKKVEYDKKYHSTPERRKYRAQLVQKRRELGIYGKFDGKDVDHKSKTEMKLRSATANRADKKKKIFKNKKK